ncbi:hypothetical protein ALC60_14593 [Trachymyrmex zeteki]|uniref:Uncharacterized protein n=1 Tax=Mycetomoellerius zeteki TaxID=64791 RepID=A0A151WF98_9HYME|nr:hypothetical protein ALC60_14593 [Trachymyrmex zeteki]
MEFHDGDANVEVAPEVAENGGRLAGGEAPIWVLGQRPQRQPRARWHDDNRKLDYNLREISSASLLENRSGSLLLPRPSSCLFGVLATLFVNYLVIECEEAESHRALKSADCLTVRSMRDFLRPLLQALLREHVTGNRLRT